MVPIGYWEIDLAVKSFASGRKGWNHSTQERPLSSKGSKVWLGVGKFGYFDIDLVHLAAFYPTHIRLLILFLPSTRPKGSFGTAEGRISGTIYISLAALMHRCIGARYPPRLVQIKSQIWKDIRVCISRCILRCIELQSCSCCLALQLDSSIYALFLHACNPKSLHPIAASDSHRPCSVLAASLQPTCSGRTLLSVTTNHV